MRPGEIKKVISNCSAALSPIAVASNFAIHKWSMVSKSVFSKFTNVNPNFRKSKILGTPLYIMVQTSMWYFDGSTQDWDSGNTSCRGTKHWLWITVQFSFRHSHQSSDACRILKFLYAFQISKIEYQTNAEFSSAYRSQYQYLKSVSYTHLTLPTKA